MAERLEVAGDWQRVSVKFAWLDMIGTLIFAVVGAVAVFCISHFAIEADVLIALLFAAIPFVFFGVIALCAFLRVRRIGYMLRADDLLVRRGMLFRRFVAVPYGRMQIVDITQGPVERMLSLKTLKFVTAAAASAVTIPGLEGQLAEQLRDHLVAAAESRRAGL